MQPIVCVINTVPEVYFPDVGDAGSEGQDSPDETRLLVLGVQVLLGFQFQAFFQDDFAHLPSVSEALCAAGLMLQTLSLGFLDRPLNGTPVGRTRFIVETAGSRDQDRPRCLGTYLNQESFGCEV